MFKKHAVWCQCAVVFAFVLAISSVLSIQSITVDVDIYWSIVFAAHAFLHFVIAEHGPMFNISPQTWLKMHPNTMANACLLFWSIPSWHASIAYLGLPVIAAASLYKKPDIVLAIAAVTRTIFYWDTALITMFALLAISRKKINVQNKSMASIQQKQRFVKKS